MTSKALLTLLIATAAIRLTPDKHYLYLTFSDLRNVARVSYVATYDTDKGQKGFEGGYKLANKTLKSTRRQIMGTCSSGKCVFQNGIKNVQLQATFVMRSGGITTSSQSLP
jgi:hypothetical protein